MGRPRELTPSASPLHFFGSEVRRARIQARMSLVGLAAMVPCDGSTVSRIETGFVAPDRHFAEVCDEAFPHFDGWFARFYAESRDWNAPFAVPFRPFTQDEAEATALYAFEPALVPGLLQTEDYARAVLSRHPNVSDGEVAERVAARLARQAVLTRDEPPLVWFVLDAAVLHSEVGGPKVMYEALRHVAEMSQHPNVTTQILTSSVHVGLQGSVWIAEKADASATASVEDMADGRLVEDAATVGMLATRFRHLQTEALAAADSLALIAQIAEERWNT
ncbi:MAG: helix-turn-helix domain-containing protein [Streptosporangiaceae bacterium]|nr:helix-turn-helix domain-containing protein [Streptosporangiaceae bacterium]